MMFRRIILLAALLVIGLAVASCGTVATPAYQATEEAELPAVVAQQPTETLVPPTATPLPPTETPVPPTEIPTEIPTEVPTEPATSAGAQNDPLAIFVSIANAEHGAQLFLAQGCQACHNVANEETLVGPGLLNVVERAGGRVPGEGPYTYLYNSIRYSQHFIVEGFPANVMPNFDGILSDADIYDLIAYVSSLTD